MAAVMGVQHTKCALGVIIGDEAHNRLNHYVTHSWFGDVIVAYIFGGADVGAFPECV